MDPVGFGFEGFDGIGRFVAGADVSGEVVGSVTLGGKFNGVAELSSKMAKSPEVHECFIRQWIKFGYGISESPDSLLLAKKMGEGFASSGTRIHSMVVALTQVDPFYRRRGAPGAVSADPVSSGPTPPPSASVPAATPPSPSSSAGTTPPPSGDPSSSSPSSPMTPVSLVSGIDVTQVRDVEQSGGIQKEVTVKNVGAAPLEWKVKFPKRGTLVHQWNTEVSVQGTDWVFSGKDYNRTVAPGQTATFGFITKD
jgi:hypothetical protein